MNFILKWAQEQGLGLNGASAELKMPMAQINKSIVKPLSVAKAISLSRTVGASPLVFLMEYSRDFAELSNIVDTFAVYEHRLHELSSEDRKMLLATVHALLTVLEDNN